MPKKKQSAGSANVIKKIVPSRKKTVKDEEASMVRGASGYLFGGDKKKIVQRFKNSTTSKNWWLEEEDSLSIAIENIVSTIENAQSSRRLLNLNFARMYGNYEALGYLVPSSRLNPSNNKSNPIKLNIIQSVIDAVAAKVAKDQPKVTFVTTGADDYFLKLRATYLTKYIAGLFKESKLYENAELVFRDAEVTGTGYLKIFAEDGKIKTEWCFQDEIRVDELDGMKQKPRSMHQIKLMSREQLLVQYPEHQQKIESALSPLDRSTTVNTVVDMVRVTESWHLPSSPEAGDGLHCITIPNCTLFTEPYAKDYFPIIAFRWYNRPLGFFGRSITEEIASIQMEINKILATIQRAQELQGSPLILCPAEAEINEDALMQNVIARLVVYKGGAAPTPVTPTAISGEYYSHLNSLIQWAFQIVGLSQTTASGQKPAGVDSAVAIREVADIETGRFAMVAKRWEDFFVKAARIMVDMSKDLYEQNPDLSVTYQDSRILKEIKWSKVDLQNNPLDIQSFPTSQLPDTPAGRVQTIAEYIANQWISKERGMELLNLDPDLEQEVNIQTASLRLTEKWLSEMVEDNVYHKPDPYMNLLLAQQISEGVYCMLLHDGCPDDRLELVRDFIEECKDLMKKAQKQQLEQEREAALAQAEAQFAAQAVAQGQPPPPPPGKPGEAPPNIQPPMMEPAPAESMLPPEPPPSLLP